MSDQHSVKAFDRELDQLGRRILDMGGFAAKMVSDAMEALSSVDSKLALFVVRSDPRVDAMQREIEAQAIAEIARRQPVASDLRAIIGAIRIAGNLERVGDLAKNIARRSIKIGADARVTGAVVGLRRMAEIASEMLTDVLDAYATRDAARAQTVWSRDAELDSLQDIVLRDVVTHMLEDPRNIASCAHLLFCTKNIERVGDHATNIAEAVYYMVTGVTLPTVRPRGQTAARDTEIGVRLD